MGAEDPRRSWDWDAEVTSLRPGSVIDGKYRLSRQIGQGGVGKVFAATHLSLDQEVAIKVLLRDSPQFIERFRREARRAALFRGEHVARVLDVGDLPGGAPYMVMELLRGRDLADLLKERGRLPVPEAVDYVLQACLGLAEVHASGVVHRDLKPSNLFLSVAVDQSTIVKLLDFGVSKDLVFSRNVGGLRTTTRSMLGSPQYMSPEQVRSARSVGTPTDIWALGVILFQLIAGRLPFAGTTMAALLREIVEDPPPRPRSLVAELPPDLELTILRCLDKEPLRRPHVAELAAELASHGPPHSRLLAERVARIFDAGPRPSLTSIPSAEELGIESPGSERPLDGKQARADRGEAPTVVEKYRDNPLASGPRLRADVLRDEPQEEEAAAPPTAPSTAPSTAPALRLAVVLVVLVFLTAGLAGLLLFRGG